MRDLMTDELELVAGAGDAAPEPTKKGNNGLGNGDQLAPGGSLDHNGAENNVSNTTGTGNPQGGGKFGVVPN